MSGVILIVENYFSPLDGGGATHVNIFQNYYKITKSKCGVRGGANIIFPGGGRWLKARWGDIKSE